MIAAQHCICVVAAFHLRGIRLLAQSVQSVCVVGQSARYARLCCCLVCSSSRFVSHSADEILARFPPIYCTVGALDPLLDDSVYFCERLAALGKEVELHVWDGLAHGFCNLAKRSKHCRYVTRHMMHWLSKRVFGVPLTASDGVLYD